MKKIGTWLIPAVAVWMMAVSGGLADTLQLPAMRVPVVKVAEITPGIEPDGTITLHAELSDPKAEGKVTVEWRFDGDSHGYGLRPVNDTTAALTPGEEGTEIRVRACLLSNGKETGGCAALVLKAGVLKELLDQKKWQEIRPAEWNEPNFICLAMDDDELQYVFYKVGSAVNTVTREYKRDDVDLSVKVTGGMLSIHRRYFGGKWRWDHNRDRLRFIPGPGGGVPIIKKGDVAYRMVPGDGDVYVNGTYRIYRNDRGYRWTDKSGRWRRYGQRGLVTAFGDRKGIVGRYLYKEGKLRYVSDRDNRVVFRFLYDKNGLLRRVLDQNGREVRYRYQNGRLTGVRDVSGGRTRYRYDGKGLLVGIEGPGAR